MKTSIYVARISCPFGIFTVAVDTDFETSARADVRSAVAAETRCHVGQVSFLDQPRKTTRRVLGKLSAVKGCESYSSGEPKTWAWSRFECR